MLWLAQSQPRAKAVQITSMHAQLPCGRRPVAVIIGQRLLDDPALKISGLSAD